MMQHCFGQEQRNLDFLQTYHTLAHLTFPLPILDQSLTFIA
jgi:hypothetical protein